MPAGCVIVGGGQGGFHCANALREAGYSAPVTIVEADARLPYERPPLSKKYLLGEAGADDLLFRPEKYYGIRDIRVLTGSRAVGLDTDAGTLALESGDVLGYDDLVLATGSHPRGVPVPGADLRGVHRLASIEDADALGAALETARRVVVVGAGFIGLEAAAVASARGLAPTVVNLTGRALERAASTPLAGWLQRWHEERGVVFRHGTGLAGIRGESGRAAGVLDDAGEEHPADLVIVGIGAAPATELAEAAGLSVDGGVVVDTHLRAAEHVYAIGDCARYPHALLGQEVRLESVQNATDHARAVADALTGSPHPYRAAPWFWSDQGDLKIQIAGLTGPSTEHVVRGGTDGGRFSVFCYRDGAFLGVDSVGRAADHVLARKLLAAGVAPTPGQAADPAFRLKTLLEEPVPA